MNPQTTCFADGPCTSEMFHMNNPVPFNTITPTKHHPPNRKRLDNYAGNHTPWPTRTAPSETLAELAQAFTFPMHRTRYWKYPNFRLNRHSRMKLRATQHGKGTLSRAEVVALRQAVRLWNDHARLVVFTDCLTALHMVSRF
jgi:hypothetical protein